MLNTTLYENSMFDTPQARAALVADGKLCTELFFINYVGFLGLYALNDSRGYMKTYEQTEKKLKISEIADDNHDASLVIKLCVESGVLAEAKTVQVTKLLALIKQRTVRSKDIDGVRIRALVEQTMLHVKPMAAPVKTVVDAFMAGTIDIKEFARQIYDVAKNNAWRPYTNEFRTLVLKGQYTDYFTAMKRGGSVAPPANQAASPAATKASTPAPAPAKPAALKGPSADDFKKVVENAVGSANGNGGAAVGALETYVLSFPLSANDMVVAGIKNAIENLPLTVFKNGWRRGGDRRRFAAELELRAMESAITSGDWIKVDVNAADSFGWMTSPSPEISFKAREIVSKAVKTFGTPTDANFDSWQALSAIYMMLYPANKEREDDLGARIKLGDATAHNIHLKPLLASDSHGSAHLLDAGTLSPKALAWARKYGSTVRGTKLIVSAAMTSTVWSQIGVDDRILWLAANWTSEGARKVSGFVKSMKVPVNVAVATQAARTRAIALIDKKWSDAALVQQMLQASSIEGGALVGALAAMASAAAMLEARKALEVPVGVKNYFNLDASGVMTHEVEQLLAFISSLPIATAKDVDTFTGFMKQITNTRARRIIRRTSNIDLASNDVKASGVQWLGWSYLNRFTPDGVVSTSGDVIRLDPAKTSPEVAEWVRQFGETSPVKIKFVETKNSKEAFAEAVFTAVTVPDKRDMNYVVDAAVIEEVKAMTTDEWYALTKRMWETKRHPDMFKIREDYLFSLVARDSLQTSKFPGLLKAANRFVTNELSYDDSKNVSSHYISTEYLVAPLTAEKIKFVKDHLSARLRYGGNSTYDVNEVAALLDSGVEANLFDADSADAAASIAKAVLATDPDLYGISMQKAMDAGNEAMKPVIAAIGASNPLASKAFPSYRWAWGIDGAMMTEILKDINATLAADAAAGKFDPHYDPVRLLVNNPAVESRVNPDLLTLIKRVYNTFVSGYEKPTITITPWVDEIDLSELKPAPTQVSQSSGAVFSNLLDLRVGVGFLQGATKTDEAVRALLQPIFDEIKAGRMTRVNGHGVDILVEIGKEYGISDDDLRACVSTAFKHYADTNAKPVDYAELAGRLQKNATDYVSTADMAIIIKKLTSSESQACQEAIANMAYTSTSNGAVSKSFIDAVRAAGNERTVVNRLRKTSILGQAVARINGDPNGVRINVTPARMNEFLKYNDVDVDAVGTIDAKRLEDFGQLSDKLNAVIPPLALAEDTSPGAQRQRIVELHKSNKYNHDPALGLEVKRVFTVNLPGQRDRFDAWVAKNPRTKIVTLYHGTGTYAAQFLLRYGFRIIKSSDGSVTGRMLGDGIYFADNINKSMLYMSNSGYIRQAGQEGYVFKCKVALGERPRDHREGYAERSSLVSNEWSIFSTDQIVIEEAYHGVSRRRQEIQQMLVEASTAYSPNVSSFMFMDGLIPLGNDMLTEFDKLPKLGAHVTIETSAKGPIVNIRHDRTVRPVDRCYRYGEELYAVSRDAELKQFLALLQNRY